MCPHHLKLLIILLMMIRVRGMALQSVYVIAPPNEFETPHTPSLPPYMAFEATKPFHLT
ncbi:hypothetical protein Scep_002596 [Stephania cephalantha]|uniref:Uncharacterized protein n=1 Tax=Stephania cephalantha TaxID=152367 RepID=A0AAP0LBB1_9MAGN